MSIILQIGAESTCWEHLLTQAAEALKRNRGKGTLILLPSPALARRFGEELLSRVPSGGIGWLRTHTPLSLAEEIFHRSHQAHLRIVSPYLKALLLEEILHTESLNYFVSVHRFPGFLHALGDLCSGISACKVAPNELDQILGRTDRELELGRLYRRFFDELHRQGLCEEPELLHQAAEMLSKGTSPLGMPDRILAFGFNRFEPAELALLEAVAGVSGSTEILLPRIPGNRGIYDPASALAQSAQWLSGASHRVLPPPSNRAVPLQQLSERIFDDPSNQLLEANGAIRVIAGMGAVGEMEMLAREIRNLVANEGYLFSDMLILSRTSEPWASSLKEVLARFDIPCDTSAALPMLQSPLVVALMTLLEAVTENWPRDKVMSVLRSSYLGLEPDITDAIEQAVREHAIFSGRDAWMSVFEPESLREAKGSCLAKMDALAKRLSGRMDAGAFRDIIRATVGAEGFDVVRRTMEGSDANRAARDLRALDRLVSILDEMANMGDAIFRGKFLALDWIRLLRDALSQEAITETCEQPDGVRIRSVGQAMSYQAKVVFLVGMTEGSFPLQPQENLFFRDREIQRMASRSKLKLRERLRIPEEERFLFHQAISKATDRIYFTYTASDSAGKPKQRSFYVDEALALFDPQTVVHEMQELSRVVPQVEMATTFDELSLSVLQELTDPKDARRSDYAKEAAWALWALEILPQDRFDTIRHILDSQTDVLPPAFDTELLPYLETIGRQLNAYKLNDYGACPFKFYCAHVLALGDLREGVDGLSEGSAMHRVMEELIRAVRERFGDTRFLPERREGILHMGHDIIERSMRATEFREDRRYRIELARIKLRMALARFVPLEEEYQAATGARPEATEIRFGPDHRQVGCDRYSSDEPLVIADDSGGDIRILGRIDRLDLLPDGRGVLADYKSSGDKIRHADIEEGKCFQLPIYLMAAEEKLGISPAAALYVGMRKGEREGLAVGPSSLCGASGVKVSTEDFGWLRDAISGWVRDYSARIREGQFPAAPDRGACDRCGFGAICRIGENGAMAEQEVGEDG